MTAPASYRHVQPFTALWLLLPAACGGAGALTAPTTAVPLVVATVLSCGLLLIFGRLVIELRGRHLHWSFGFVGWPRWSVALDEIVSTEVARPHALQGAGIRGLGRDRLYNVTLGGPALSLGLRDGRSVMLGTPEPQRLAAFIAARTPAA